MHPELALLAAARGGAFTRADALRLGYTQASIRHNVRSRRWLALSRGIYVVGDAWRAAGDLGRTQLAAAAACLAVPGAVASHETAARLTRIATLGQGDDLYLTRERQLGHHHHKLGRHVHVAALPPNHLVSRHGVPMTGPARTVVDLGRLLTLEAGVVAADSALHNLLADAEGLRAVLAECAGWPGIQQARRAVELSDGRAESPLESVSRVVMWRHEVPPPELQAWVAGYRVDFLWEGRKTVGEADGMVKYDGSDPAALAEEKIRQERIEDAGYEVVRWRWAHVRDGGAALATRLARAFARAERRWAA